MLRTAVKFLRNSLDCVIRSVFVEYFFKFLFFFYIFIYSGVWHFVHKNVFEFIGFRFDQFNFFDFFGLLNFYVALLDFENLFLTLYIIFYEIGFSVFFEERFSWATLCFNWRWLFFYEHYWSEGVTPTMFLLSCFYNYVASFFSGFTVLGDVLSFFCQYPMFFYFALLFFFSILLCYFFLTHLGFYGVFSIVFISLVLFWISLLFYINEIFINQRVYIIDLGKWIFISSNLRLGFYFLIDTISFSFILLTTTIAVFVFAYAFSYFRYEPLVERFILFLASFVVSMLFLVSSGNTIMMFLGWELIGLTSFLLINFWTTRIGTLKSAFKAFSFNKVSDFWLFMFVVGCFSLFYDFDVNVIIQQTHLYSNSSIMLFGFEINYIEFLCFTILGAAFVKSAQFGVHIWLPDSMEAPVPASSLIHSATLVSAGVFLVLRFNHLFEYSVLSKYLLVVVGSWTAAYGGVSAAFQSDVKKILAYSTISHCGFLMVLCFTQINEFVILYLYVHGFFKAGVFMCIGNVIRISRNYQDFRRMGSYWKYLPFEAFCVFVGLINLCGLPFTLGFVIKHLLFVGLSFNIYLYYFVLFNCFVAAFSGLFYSYRLYYNVFFDFKKGRKIVYKSMSRKNLSSNFYSNTSLASNISITLLFLVSYIICYILLKVFLSTPSLFSDCFNTHIVSNYYSLHSASIGYLFDFSYFNWAVLFFVVALLFSIWRYHSFFYKNFYHFFLFLQFLVLLYILYRILS